MPAVQEFPWTETGNFLYDYWRCRDCTALDTMDNQDHTDAVNHVRATGHRVDITHTHRTTIEGLAI